MLVRIPLQEWGILVRISPSRLQYAHDFDQSIEVHVFKPTKDKRSWYIKGYLISEKAVFISVHQSEYEK